MPDQPEYAKLSEVKTHETLYVDNGFTCCDAGPVTLCLDPECKELYFECDAGQHWLEGQINEKGELVGMATTPFNIPDGAPKRQTI